MNAICKLSPATVIHDSTDIPNGLLKIRYFTAMIQTVTIGIAFTPVSSLMRLSPRGIVNREKRLISNF